MESLQDGAHLLAGKHDRQSLRPRGADQLVEPRQLHLEHLSVEEKKRRERLVLGRGADPPLDGEAREKAGDFVASHLGRVALVVEQNEATNPLDVGALGAAAVVTKPHRSAHAVEEKRRLRSFIGRSVGRFAHAAGIAASIRKQ